MKNPKRNHNLLRFGALLVLVALWVIVPFAIGDRTASAEETLPLSDVIRIEATLTGSQIGGVTPRGFGDYRVDDQNRRRLDINGSSINLPAGTILTVSINNAVIGDTSVSTCGAFLFRRRTDDGQQVPVVTAGMPVQVSNGSSVVLAGTFGSTSPSPSPSGSPTGSPSPSPSPCASPSPSPTGSPNGTPSPSPTGSPSGTPSPSPTGSPNPSPSPTGSPNGGDLFAGLSGPTINGVLPNGFAQFEIHSSRLELEVRINQINLGGGTQLAVIVDNINVGSIFVSSGEGRLRLRTDNGQTVPPIIVGSTIAIQNGGSSILSGTFAGFTGPSPSPSPSPSPTGSPGPSPSPTASPSPGGSPSPSPSPSLGRSFESHLTGAGVTPAVQTAATGEVKVTLNATETQATIFGEFHNLGSNQTAARIEALVGDGVLIHNLGVVGGNNGNFASVTIDVSPAQISQLRSGIWSAVITSVNNPGGEIRGRFVQRSNLADFDGDGSNDLALFRPADGNWYSLNGAGFTATNFGTASDKVVSADYDGDGRTDTAVFRNVGGLGVWQIKRSSDGGESSEQFGVATDIATRGDFDGDGINDLAVYRPSTGVWYIKKSTNTGFVITRFGLAEDKPLPLDVDGDGRDDIAVFRPSDGNWYWLRSSDGQFGVAHFGLSGDIPVRGDFDGDGKSDLVVYRPSAGVWYISYSSNGGFQATRFGLDGDIPVAGNYDGDNRTDIAVFRPSEGKWYILRSSDGGFQAMQFGLNGDVPTIAR